MARGRARQRRRPGLVGGWGLGAAEIGWLTSAVQLGFVAGTAVSALLNVPDLVAGRVLVAVCALPRRIDVPRS